MRFGPHAYWPLGLHACEIFPESLGLGPWALGLGIRPWALGLGHMCKALGLGPWALIYCGKALGPSQNKL